MPKPNVNFTLSQLRSYVRTHKINRPEIRLGMKRAELISGLKKHGHWEETGKQTRQRKPTKNTKDTKFVKGSKLTDKSREALKKKQQSEARKKLKSGGDKPVMTKPKEDGTITITRVTHTSPLKKYKAKVSPTKRKINNRSYYAVAGVKGVYVPAGVYDKGIRIYDDPYSNTNHSGNYLGNPRTAEYDDVVKDGVGVLQYEDRGLTASQIEDLKQVNKHFKRQ